ncbi:transposable element Tcb2 transposase [Trichonephila clavipes]|nr:transposable element Tcb2 transposase [Trichonephila clavipes]
MTKNAKKCSTLSPVFYSYLFKKTVGNGVSTNAAPKRFLSEKWLQFILSLRRKGFSVRSPARLDSETFDKGRNQATRKTTRREDQRIVRQALVDPTVTLSTIRADVGVAIVPQTISRHLAEANLKSKRPFCALPLTLEHRQLRLQWYQARSMWNVTDWQKVVFRDESRFVLETHDNRVRVWRHPAYDSRSTFTVMRGTLMGQRYVDDILRLHVGRFLNGLPEAILQQDNARPHTARVAQDFLRHFQTLPWPPRSLDLFSVEDVWDQSSMEIDELLHYIYTSDTISQMQAFEWHQRFREGRESIEDVECFGRSQTSRIAKNLEKVSTVVLDQRSCSHKSTGVWNDNAGAF